MYFAKGAEDGGSEVNFTLKIEAASSSETTSLYGVTTYL
jgi:hypothetical protein